MTFKEGRKKTGGRAKGTRNLATESMKDAIENAFHVLGGRDYLIKLGEKDPKTFIALLAKLLPHVIAGSLDVNVSLADALEDADEPRKDEGG